MLILQDVSKIDHKNDIRRWIMASTPVEVSYKYGLLYAQNRPHIITANGWRLSIQADVNKYCSPRRNMSNLFPEFFTEEVYNEVLVSVPDREQLVENECPYTQVEVGLFGTEENIEKIFNTFGSMFDFESQLHSYKASLRKRDSIVVVAGYTDISVINEYLSNDPIVELDYNFKNEFESVVYFINGDTE